MPALGTGSLFRGPSPNSVVRSHHPVYVLLPPVNRMTLSPYAYRRSVSPPLLFVPPATMNRCDVAVQGVGLQLRLPPAPMAAFARGVGADTLGEPNEVDGNGSLLPGAGGWTAVQPIPPFGFNVYQVPAGSTTPPSTSGAAPPYINTDPDDTVIEAPTRGGGVSAVVVVVEMLVICSHPIAVPPSRSGCGAKLLEMLTPSSCATPRYEAGGEEPPSASTV